MKQNLFLKVIATVIAVELFILIVDVRRLTTNQGVPSPFMMTSGSYGPPPPTDVRIVGIQIESQGGELVSLPVYDAGPRSRAASGK